MAGLGVGFVASRRRRSFVKVSEGERLRSEERMEFMKVWGWYDDDDDDDDDDDVDAASSGSAR